MSTSINGLKARRNRRQDGNRAEEFAAQYLERSLGWQVVVRNWRCRWGELDIVAFDGAQLIVVEVRSRSQGDPKELTQAIDGKKLRQLQRVVWCYYWRHHAYHRFVIRVDAIVLFQTRGLFHSIVHVQDILNDFPPIPRLQGFR